MLTALQQINILKFDDKSEVDHPDGFAAFLKQIIPPLLIIGLNQVLLLLIDYAG